jgi:hypothetical protein
MHRFGVTLVRQVCAFCGEPKGLRLWRWSGRIFVTSHTLCARCSLGQSVLVRARSDAASDA